MGPGTLTHGSGIPGQRFITRNHLLWGGPLAGQAFRPRGCTRPSALGFTAQDRMDGSCSDSHVSSQPQASPSHPRGDTAQLPLHSQDRRTAPSPPASQPASPPPRRMLLSSSRSFCPSPVDPTLRVPGSWNCATAGGKAQGLWGGREQHLGKQIAASVEHNTYEWSPWTPPSIWADMVRFSNFSSPEYIIDLARGSQQRVRGCPFVLSSDPSLAPMAGWLAGGFPVPHARPSSWITRQNLKQAGGEATGAPVGPRRHWPPWPGLSPSRLLETHTHRFSQSDRGKKHRAIGGNGKSASCTAATDALKRPS